VVSFPLIMILYELFVRRFNIVRFFFGMRPKKNNEGRVAVFTSFTLLYNGHDFMHFLSLIYKKHKNMTVPSFPKLKLYRDSLNNYIHQKSVR
jgi:hypothetical protein